MRPLNERTVLIVGATSGIGLALARRLVRGGATVISTSRGDGAALRELGISHHRIDVRSDVGEALGAALPDKLDGLVYCPGSITLKPFPRLTLADFQNDLDINLFGAVRVIQAALPALKKSGDAGVVLFSTVASQVGMNFHASIASAKSAVEGLGKSLAAEFASAGIRVNVVAPSLTRTPMAGNLLSNEEREAASAKRHPISRIGDSEEMAATAAFLLSPEAGWITGQVLPVDGGMSALRPI